MSLATRRSPASHDTSVPDLRSTSGGASGGASAGASDPAPNLRPGLPRYDRQPNGEAYAYRGYTIVPMLETLDAPARQPTQRTRWDVLETLPAPDAPDAEPLVTRRKTCASQITAEGWVDAFGDVS